MRKYSKQRELILDILKKSYSHPTANEVFLEARKIDNQISLGTVYRNIELLCKDEVIEKISTLVSIDRYDYKKSNHSHVICEKCGKIFDFEPKLDLNQIKEEVLNQTNVNMNHNEVRIIGICQECN